MGFGRSFRHAVKKAAKVVVGAAKEAVQDVKNPFGAVKDIIKNPMGAIAKDLGLTALFGGGKLPAQTEIPQLKGDENENAAQDRARMISRQGAQNNAATMLLGQGVDWDSLDLSKDEELGGRKA